MRWNAPFAEVIAPVTDCTYYPPTTGVYEIYPSTIQCLRAEVDTLRAERDAARAEVERLRAALSDLQTALQIRLEAHDTNGLWALIGRIDRVLSGGDAT